MPIVELIFAILLPPLGVALRCGVSVAFWVSLVLTIIGWVPGVIFALVAVLRPDILPPNWTQRRLI